MLKKKLPYFAAIVLAIAIAAAYVIGWNDTDSSPPSAQKVAEIKDPPCPLPVISWKTDARQMYTYELTTDVKMDLSALSGGKDVGSNSRQNARTSISGLLNFRVFEPSDSERIHVGFQLSPVRVVIQGQRTPDLESLYSTFFVVAFSKQGTPELFYFSAALSPTDKDTLSELVRAVQISVPPETEIKDKTSREWARSESRSTGLFQAEYAISEADCNAVIKKDVACLSVRQYGDASEGGTDLHGTIPQSQFRGTLASDVSWLASFSGTETLQIRLKKGDVLSESQSSVHMALRPFEPTSDLAIWKENRPTGEMLQAFIQFDQNAENAVSTWQQVREKNLAEKYKGVPLSQMIGDIEKAVAADASQSKMATFTHNLRDYLKVFPEKAHEIPGLIRQMDPDSEVIGYLLLALELTGHGDAQTALADVFDDADQSPKTRVKAIVAAGGVKVPETELIDRLFSLSETHRIRGGDEDLDCANTALLSLGVLSHSLFNGEMTDDARWINERVISILQASDDPVERAMCLKALDNSGDSEIIPVIEPFLVSEFASERQSAVRSLRSFSDAHTLSLLEDTLENDPEPRVRKSAIEALSKREETEAVEHLREHLLNETDSYLRREVVKALREHRTPEVEDTLKKQLEKETSKDVAKDIYRALYEK